MQGTLNEIDIRSILQLIELGQRTGGLLVEAYRPSTPEEVKQQKSLKTISSQGFAATLSGEFWLVFFVNGEIVYAADGMSRNCSRLQEYLYRRRKEIPPPKLSNSLISPNNDVEYAYLWQLIEHHYLTPAQGRNLIEKMVYETVFDLLSLHQGAFIFEMGMSLDPLLTSLEIAPLVTQMTKEVQQWKQLHPHIKSPQQCIVIPNHKMLQQTLPEKAYKKLSWWADGQTSLRQLSRYLQRDLVTLGRGIYPYVDRGWLQVVEHPSQQQLPLESKLKLQETEQSPHIVCLDDDLTIGKAIESILIDNGYQSTLITNPLKALSLMFEIKPDLILCDIAMPKLEGYEICAMLRHSSAFRHIPIIMLTGKEGFTERIRARMLGATDYLTKPFREQELIFLLEKYVTPPLI